MLTNELRKLQSAVWGIKTDLDYGHVSRAFDKFWGLYRKIEDFLDEVAGAAYGTA